MQPCSNSTVRLTYCLNIHPGETWDENFSAIKTHALAVRDRVSRDRDFGLGLRLSRRAAESLNQPAAMQEFRHFLQENRLYVFTINGFPYGTFHGKPVKESVYQPDWRTEERRDYTMLLADVLAQLLPDGMSGSISTVPGSYKAWIESEEDKKCIAAHLAECAAHQQAIHERTGRQICLCLEPEPDCLMETTSETVAFFEQYLLGGTCDPIAPAEVIRRYVGVCFDTCHMAVQFEDLESGLSMLRDRGIRVPKVQLSAALELTDFSTDSIRALKAYCDPVYLHQTKVLCENGTTESWPDLSEEMLENIGETAARRLRTHFHVPLYFEGSGQFSSTARDLTPGFFDMVLKQDQAHLEIETYTFDVLPQQLRSMPVEESIEKEFRWVFDLIGKDLNRR
jgi:sugar phosphate isomerase/epimerase